MKEAMLYEKLGGSTVRCFLCAHRCVIGPGKRGICAVRENRDGTLYSLVYGKIVAMNVDPIEKKPLYHFLPGSFSYSIATAGCNFKCEHCQNYEISQLPAERPDVHIPGTEMDPEDIVSDAVRNNCQSISYTYTEPTIFLEFALDCAMLARKRGVRNVFVSNGFMTPESAGAIAPYLDANNIDLKGDEKFYREICHARAAPVRETIKLMKEKGVWVEITTLVIPGHNDSEEVLRDIARFIRSVDPFIPWHVSRFYPAYHLLDSQATSVRALRRARELGFEEGLKHVYLGNVPEEEGGEDTYCPSCGKIVISRKGYLKPDMKFKEKGICPACSSPVQGRWEFPPE